MNSPAETATDYLHELIVTHPFCNGVNPQRLQATGRRLIEFYVHDIVE